LEADEHQLTVLMGSVIQLWCAPINSTTGYE